MSKPDIVIVDESGEIISRPSHEEQEIWRLTSAIRRVRNILHAWNHPNTPLPNEARIRARDILDLALEPSKDRQ